MSVHRNVSVIESFLEKDLRDESEYVKTLRYKRIHPGFRYRLLMAQYDKYKENRITFGQHPIILFINEVDAKEYKHQLKGISKDEIKKRLKSLPS
jgi:hypothetical protein